MPGPRRSTRLVLGLGIAIGLVTLVALPLRRPDQLGLAARVYTSAAEAALGGGPFYAVTPTGLPGYRFLYPPVVMLPFLPAGAIGEAAVTFAALTVASVLASLGIAWLVVGELERSGVSIERLDLVLIAGFCALSSYAAPTLVNGQVNLLLGLGITGGLIAAERRRPAPGGAAIATAATVKVFPGTVLAYLLRRRQFRAVTAAIVTGIGLAVLGIIAFGRETTHTYLSTVLGSEVQTGALASDPLAHGFLTVRRQLAALLPWLPVESLPILAVLVVAPVVALTYRRVDGPVDRWFAILATLVGTLLVLPLEGLYFPLLLFPLVPLLYALPPGWTRRLLLAGTGLTLLGLDPGALEVLAGSGVIGGPALIQLGEAVFGVILPGTLGMWLWLAAAVHWQRVDSR